MTRQKQITSLAVYHEAVETVVEGAEYRIQLRSGEPLSLLVQLPSDFPAGQPQVFIEPPVHHPWVLPTTGRVTQAPGLLNFSLHSDLGMVVNAIKREFEKCDSLKLVSPSTSTTAMESGATPDPVTAALAAMTREELQEVMESEVAMEKLLLSITFPPLDSITENIKSMKEVIRETAETNMSLETEVERKRDSLLCKVEEFHTTKLALGQAAARVRELGARVEPAVLADRLVRLSVDNEERSDEIAERFLGKELGVEEFLAQYVATRQASHLQKLKADKVKESG